MQKSSTLSMFICSVIYFSMLSASDFETPYGGFYDSVEKADSSDNDFESFFNNYNPFPNTTVFDPMPEIPASSYTALPSIAQQDANNVQPSERFSSSNKPKYSIHNPTELLETSYPEVRPKYYPIAPALHATSLTYTCSRCGYITTHSVTYNTHVLAHKNLRCDHPDCGYEGTCSYNLKNHIKIHYKNAPPCTFSGCRFTSSSTRAMKDHIYNSHREAPNLTTVIPSINSETSSQDVDTFIEEILHNGTSENNNNTVETPENKTSSARKPRQRRKKSDQSSGQQSYLCKHPGCSRTFPCRSKLEVHMNTHRDGAPSCGKPNCLFKSTRYKALALHMSRCHSGISPLACTYPDCHHEASSYTFLQTHMNTHGEDATHCEQPNCRFKSNHAPAFAKHMENRHPGAEKKTFKRR